MSAIGITSDGSAKWHGDDQASLVEQNEKPDLPKEEEKGADLSSYTAATTGSVIVVDNVDSKSMKWDFSMWLSSIIGFFGQQLVNYLLGLSEKMEKLEYY